MAYYHGWSNYVSVAARRATAQRELAKRKQDGHTVSPVVIRGRTIATTFWGKAWCDNLEQYSDYANRLPRGRTYVRNSSTNESMAPAQSLQIDFQRSLATGDNLTVTEYNCEPLTNACTVPGAICKSTTEPLRT